MTSKTSHLNLARREKSEKNKREWTNKWTSMHIMRFPGAEKEKEGRRPI